MDGMHTPLKQSLTLEIMLNAAMYGSDDMRRVSTIMEMRRASGSSVLNRESQPVDPRKKPLENVSPGIVPSRNSLNHNPMNVPLRNMSSQFMPPRFIPPRFMPPRNISSRNYPPENVPSRNISPPNQNLINILPGNIAPLLPNPTSSPMVINARPQLYPNSASPNVKLNSAPPMANVKNALPLVNPISAPPKSNTISAPSTVNSKSAPLIANLMNVPSQLYPKSVPAVTTVKTNPPEVNSVISVQKTDFIPNTAGAGLTVAMKRRRTLAEPFKKYHSISNTTIQQLLASVTTLSAAEKNNLMLFYHDLETVLPSRHKKLYCYFRAAFDLKPADPSSYIISRKMHEKVQENTKQFIQESSKIINSNNTAINLMPKEAAIKLQEKKESEVPWGLKCSNSNNATTPLTSIEANIAPKAEKKSEEFREIVKCSHLNNTATKLIPKEADIKLQADKKPEGFEEISKCFNSNNREPELTPKKPDIESLSQKKRRRRKKNREITNFLNSEISARSLFMDDEEWQEEEDVEVLEELSSKKSKMTTEPVDTISGKPFSDALLVSLEKEAMPILNPFSGTLLISPEIKPSLTSNASLDASLVSPEEKPFSAACGVLAVEKPYKRRKRGKRGGGREFSRLRQTLRKTSVLHQDIKMSQENLIMFLRNYYRLPAEEQYIIIEHMKKIEQRDPALIQTLREYVQITDPTKIKCATQQNKPTSTQPQENSIAADKSSPVETQHNVNKSTPVQSDTRYDPFDMMELETDDEQQADEEDPYKLNYFAFQHVSANNNAFSLQMDNTDSQGQINKVKKDALANFDYGKVTSEAPILISDTEDAGVKDTCDNDVILAARIKIRELRQRFEKGQQGSCPGANKLKVVNNVRSNNKQIKETIQRRPSLKNPPLPPKRPLMELPVPTKWFEGSGSLPASFITESPQEPSLPNNSPLPNEPYRPPLLPRPSRALFHTQSNASPHSHPPHNYPRQSYPRHPYPPHPYSQHNYPPRDYSPYDYPPYNHPPHSFPQPFFPEMPYNPYRY